MGVMGVADAKVVRLHDSARLLIPVELRRRLDIAPGTELEAWLQDSYIVLRKHVATKRCVFCRGEGELEFGGRPVCRACWGELAEAARRGKSTRQGRGARTET